MQRCNQIWRTKITYRTPGQTLNGGVCSCSSLATSTNLPLPQLSLYFLWMATREFQNIRNQLPILKGDNGVRKIRPFQHLLMRLATFLPISSFVCSETGTSPMYMSKNAPAKTHIKVVTLWHWNLKLTFFFLKKKKKSKDNQCSVLGKTPLHGQIYMSKCSTIETKKREINEENSLTTQILAMDCSNVITSNWKINVWNSKSKQRKLVKSLIDLIHNDFAVVH